MNIQGFNLPGAGVKLPISPLVGEMGGSPEGGAVPPSLHFGIAANDAGARSTLPPSALPGISPTRGEISQAPAFAIFAEQASDVPQRDRLLDRAMGRNWRRKSSEKLRRGRMPSQGLALVARDATGNVVGTVRLWDVAFETAFPPLAGEGGREAAGWGSGTIAPSASPSTSSGSAPPPERGRKAALLLGPLAVDPAFKSAGIGSALMRYAIEEAKRFGHSAILLVGDAAYYGRFGFSADKTGSLAMPGPYERHRFLALELAEGALDGAAGVLKATGRRAEMRIATAA